MTNPKSNPVDQATPQGAGDDRVVDWAALKLSRSAPLQPVSRASAPSGTVRKRRGRLDRTVLVMIGKGLEACFEDIRRQEVPERFKLLLRQF
jgi:hypothetical protein